MNKYFIATNKGWINTTDEKLAQSSLTIDDLIVNTSILDELTDLEVAPHKVLFITKNGNDYWEFGEYVNA